MKRPPSDETGKICKLVTHRLDRGLLRQIKKDGELECCCKATSIVVLKKLRVLWTGAAPTEEV